MPFPLSSTGPVKVPLCSAVFVWLSRAGPPSVLVLKPCLLWCYDARWAGDLGQYDRKKKQIHAVMHKPVFMLSCTYLYPWAAMYCTLHVYHSTSKGNIHCFVFHAFLCAPCILSRSLPQWGHCKHTAELQASTQGFLYHNAKWNLKCKLQSCNIECESPKA